MTMVTVKKYLASLVNWRLITERWSLAPAFQNSDDRKFFILPNEIFLLNLLPSAFMDYACLLLIEDRWTHTCQTCYNTIATETGITKNTAMRSNGALLDAELITMEHSQYFDQCGMKWTGNNLYTILPTQVAMDHFYQRQLHQLELDAERRHIRKRQEEYDRQHPRAALRTPLSAPGASGPAPAA